MHADELHLDDLLRFDAAGGIVRFAGERALILDTVALGLLRRELVETAGLTIARGVLTRFGFAHGWRTAQAFRDAVPWADESSWRRAGGRIHMLQGAVGVEVLMPTAAERAPFAEALWHDSYEAEQHLLHLGQSEETVCWTLTGFASGYLSYANGRDILCVETRCRGRGDATCHMIGDEREVIAARFPGAPGPYERRCLDEALNAVTDSLKRTERRLRERRRALLPDDRGDLDPGSGLIARSEEMRRILDLARRVSRVESTVLVTGESGVGKERIARLIHDESARGAGPFVGLNCGAVPESLLESELFGHARGAFTGATHDRAGLFESASGGTLLLDEVGEIPASVQVKLLRALQEREVRRVGENRSRPIDVRLVAATNRDLGHDVKGGTFRSDLYYRLRIVELRVPPLRERRDDILPLARAALAEVSRRTGKRVIGLAPDAAAVLLRWSWPGNVRELANALERAVVLCEGDRIEVSDLPEEISQQGRPAEGAAGVRTLEAVEREHVLATLASVGGNRARAAEVLGIGEATLYRRLKAWGPEASRSGGAEPRRVF